MKKIIGFLCLAALTAGCASTPKQAYNPEILVYNIDGTVMLAGENSNDSRIITKETKIKPGQKIITDEKSYVSIYMDETGKMRIGQESDFTFLRDSNSKDWKFKITKGSLDLWIKKTDRNTFSIITPFATAYILKPAVSSVLFYKTREGKDRSIWHVYKGQIKINDGKKSLIVSENYHVSAEASGLEKPITPNCGPFEPFDPGFYKNLDISPVTKKIKPAADRLNKLEKMSIAPVTTPVKETATSK